MRGFSQSFEGMLTSEARTVMAADLTARQFVLPNPGQTAQLDALAARGVERTLITETVSMATPPAAPVSEDAAPVLVSLKAVDPTRYPYYGKSSSNPPCRFSKPLRPIPSWPARIC